MGSAAIAAVVVAAAFGGTGTARSVAWPQFAGRVTFPIYRPSVTLGLTPALDGPVSCGYGGIESAWVTYRKGNRDVSLTEAYPRICGNAGESASVGSVDINGVQVEVRVYLQCPATCTVADGFTNGYLLYLREPGPRQTVIQVDSSHVSLDDLVSMLRSLVAVPPTRLTLAGGAFRSPTGNLWCALGDSLVFCRSRRLPHNVYLGVDGRPQTCGPGCTGLPKPSWPVLAYGGQVSLGPFRCASQTAGITCRVIRTRKGFLINRAGSTRVGP